MIHNSAPQAINKVLRQRQNSIFHASNLQHQGVVMKH